FALLVFIADFKAVFGEDARYLPTFVLFLCVVVLLVADFGHIRLAKHRLGHVLVRDREIEVRNRVIRHTFEHFKLITVSEKSVLRTILTNGDALIERTEVVTAVADLVIGLRVFIGRTDTTDPVFLAGDLNFQAQYTFGDSTTFRYAQDILIEDKLD